jgi:RHS repeat-associated protein
VTCSNGDFWHTFADVSIPGRGIPLNFFRTYNSLAAPQDSPLGFGWTDSYNLFLTTDSSGAITVYEEGGSNYTFTSPSAGMYQAPASIMATLVKNADGTFTLTRKASQARYTFSAPTPRGLLQKEVDRNGYTTALSYTNGQLTSVTDPAGRALTLTYNTSNRIATMNDPANRSVNFTYDSSANLTDVIDVNGGHWHFTYDANHLLKTMEDPRQYALQGPVSTGPVVANVYDGIGRVTSQTDPMSRTTTFSYAANADGTQTTTVTDPKGHVEVQTYQNDNLLTDVLGSGTPQAATWRYTYDPATLAVTQETDPNNHLWTSTWDSSGNELTSTDPLNHQTVYTYDSLNDVTSVTEPNDAGTSTTTTLVYDSAGNLKSASRPLKSTGQTATTTYIYGDTAHPGDVTYIIDPNQHITSVGYSATTGDLVSSTDGMGDKTTYTFDGVGRMLTTVSPKGNVAGGNPATYTTTFGFNAFGDTTSVTDPNQHQTVYGYDPNRNRTSVKDARLNTTTYNYNNGDEPTGVGYPDGTSTGTSYDANGNLQAQSDGLNRTTSYGYDPLDRQISRTDPLTRTWTYGYDGAGNVTTVTDPTTPTGRVTTYGYDAANRPISITYSDGTTPNVTAIGYDSDGQRISQTDAATGTSTYTYDSLHRLTLSKDGAGKYVGYGYNLGGNLTTLYYPDATQVTRGYDAANRMTKITDWAQNSTTFSYDQNSNLTVQSYPNGTSATFTYDPTDTLTQIVDKYGTVPVWTFGYTRDENNQVKTASDPVDKLTHTYTYDTLNRFTDDSTLTGSYGYDPANELTSGTLPGSNVVNYGYDTASELTSFRAGVNTCPSQGPCTLTVKENLTLAYNPDGDRLSQSDSIANTMTNYAYDQAARLTSFTKGTASASYKYNGDGLRMSKTVGGTNEPFVWDVADGLPLILQDGSTKYVTGPSGLPLEQVHGNTILYYYQDQLGSTRALADQNAQNQAQYTYDAYGNVTSSTGSVTNPFQYAGQYTDGESGLQYLRARYYDPNTQQFLTVDPMADQTGQPYGYAGDNPVNAVDPAGLCSSNSQRPQSVLVFNKVFGNCRFLLRDDTSPGQRTGDAPHFNFEIKAPRGRTTYNNWHIYYHSENRAGPFTLGYTWRTWDRQTGSDRLWNGYGTVSTSARIAASLMIWSEFFPAAVKSCGIKAAVQMIGLFSDFFGATVLIDVLKTLHGYGPAANYPGYRGR